MTLARQPFRPTPQIPSRLAEPDRGSRCPGEDIWVDFWDPFRVRVEMRADMAKVIVERPRWKGWCGKKPKGYLRRLHRYGEEGPPTREGIKACWQGNTKGLNEHLGPLRRYLDSAVGRPWDKVFSEICAHINRNSAVQDHVRDHVAQYVNTNVILIDGVPCDGMGGRTHGMPLQQISYRPWWYVCPLTGLLRRIKVVRRKRPRKPLVKKLPKFIPLGDRLQCRLIGEAWYLITLKPLPKPYYGCESCTAVDVLLKIPAVQLTSSEARRHYGAEVYASAQRRLAYRELKQYPIPERWWKEG